MSNPEAPGIQLAESLQEPVARYARRLQELAGPRLMGLTVYGAAVIHAYDPTGQAARNVVLFDRVELDVLRQLAAEGPRFARLGIAAPLVMTPQFIQASLDTFPLELLEIQSQHITVLGDDYFSRLTFAPQHVRLQCERELEALLVGMHQGLLATGGDERKLSNLETNLVEEILRILRGAAWLKGQREPRPAFQLVADVERLLGRSLAGVLAALDDADMAGWHKFRNLYDDIQALGQWIDAL